MFFAFMIFLFRIDVPNVLFVGFPISDMGHSLHGRKHGVVHVVVSVLSVPPDTI